MEKRIYTIYKHTCPNGKVYIGVTKQKVENRWLYGWGYMGNQHFMNAISKYGWENIQHEIVFIKLTEKEAYQKEAELIALYKSNQREFGYNICNGGKGTPGHKASEKSKEQMRKIALMRKGLPVREETKKKLSENHKGQKNPMFGKRLTEEHKNKISSSLKGKMTGKFIGGKSARAQKIDMFDKQGNFIRTFEASTDAERETKIAYSSIIKCCNFQRNSAGGFIWRYHNNGKKEIEPLKYVKQNKKVNQYDLQGNYIKTWGSIKEASESLNISNGAISRVCSGKHKTTKGYIWRFKDEIL